MRLLPAILLLLSPAFAQAAPQRIVSMNPCADAILREIAEPRRIAAVSRLSHDEASASVPVAWARRYPGVGARAEELLAIRADLVIAGPFVPRETGRMIARLGIPLITLPIASNIGESRAQIAELARAIGEPERGAALIARIDRAVAAARPTATHPADARPVPALIRQDSGMVPGRGTLADDMLASTGFANVASRYGLQSWDILSLERLAADPPALLFTGDGLPGHAVLSRLAPRMRTHAFPMRYLWCAGPTIIDAVNVLAAARGTP